MFGPDKQYHGYTQFNFSGLKGQTKISRKGLHYYSSKVTLVFACVDREFLNYFIAQLFEQKDIMLGSLHLVPDSVEDELPVDIHGETRFLCISPIVPVPASFNGDEGKKFITPESDEFSDLLYDSTLARMEATGKYSAETLAAFYKFQIAPDPGYLQRLQASHKKFARIYPLYDNDVKFEIRGYTFPFTLYADPEVQRFVYENGLGFFCHKGFGMLDVANNDTIRRETQRDVAYVSS